MRIWSYRDLSWRGDSLCAGRRVVVRIEKDHTYPKMWRVIEADGSRSDMVNRTRAKDAAKSRALSILNMQETVVG